MKKTKRGFLGALLLIVAALIIVGGVGYAVVKDKKSTKAISTSGMNDNSAPTSSPAVSSPASSTQATYSIPTNWKTYTNTQYGFTLQYPNTWQEPVVSNYPSTVDVEWSGLKMTYSTNYSNPVIIGSNQPGHLTLDQYISSFPTKPNFNPKEDAVIINGISYKRLTVHESITAQNGDKKTVSNFVMETIFAPNPVANTSFAEFVNEVDENKISESTLEQVVSSFKFN